MLVVFGKLDYHCWQFSLIYSSAIGLTICSKKPATGDMTEDKIGFKFNDDAPEEVLFLGVRDGKLFVEGNLDKGAKLFFEQLISKIPNKTKIR